jgi:ABC-2 type transport system ATP-binding protein
MPMDRAAVTVEGLSHSYGSHKALDDVRLRVNAGEIFGFLGPNGSGKTTLFRILATLVSAPIGAITILGFDPAAHPNEVRSRIGVLFQSPSLDKQLTARENLMHQGHLYGLRGADLRSRSDAALTAVNLIDRADERVDRFSGGMRRRVEVAKGLLHRPQVLLLDEPSTGLDPTARIEMWDHLRQINSREGVTILVTTHLMDEADHCTRLAIMEKGRVLACDTPANLKERVGGDVITITTAKPVELLSLLRGRFGVEAQQLNRTLRIERPRGHELVPQLIEAAPGLVESIAVGKPTLEDVFISLTGQRLEERER